MNIPTPAQERQRLSGDHHRPRYHFLPPSNWMNDPNGLIQWDGQYHLFYQYNPLDARWGVIHWGHAVSSDLVHWSDLPIALSPTPGGPDADGCWSGCIVDNGGVPTMLYTGVREQAQRPCLATSADGLVTWQMHSGNPVIAALPEELEGIDFRDHCVWREGDTWYQLIGGKLASGGGAALLYRSRDLVEWEYLHPLCVGDPAESGAIWECPDLFTLGGGKHVLMVSPIPLRKTLYFIGAYADHRFLPERLETVDAGGHFYAPQSMVDGRGRRLMWGWIWEGRTEAAQLAAGWAGVMSLPRVLSSRPDGTLGFAPAAELAALRDRHWRWDALQISADQPLGGVRSDAVEIIAEFDPGGADVFGVDVRCSADGGERTRIAYDRERQWLEIDRSQASASPEDQHDRQGGALTLDEAETLTLRIFVDRSVIEVFANGRMCLTSRVYPLAESLGVALFAQGGSVDVRSIDIWNMRSIWTD
jgi:beta-fructofuranosidase